MFVGAKLGQQQRPRATPYGAVGVLAAIADFKPVQVEVAIARHTVGVHPDVRGVRYCLAVPIGVALWGLVCLLSGLLTKCS